MPVGDSGWEASQFNRRRSSPCVSEHPGSGQEAPHQVQEVPADPAHDRHREPEGPLPQDHRQGRSPARKHAGETALESRTFHLYEFHEWKVK